MAGGAGQGGTVHQTPFGQITEQRFDMQGPGFKKQQRQQRAGLGLGLGLNPNQRAAFRGAMQRGDIGSFMAGQSPKTAQRFQDLLGGQGAMADRARQYQGQAQQFAQQREDGLAQLAQLFAQRRQAWGA